EGHRLRLTDPIVRPAAVSAREGPAHRQGSRRRPARAGRRHRRLRRGLPRAARENERGMSESLAVYTPIPPARTGVAHYASMLIPALQTKTDVEVISSPGQRPTANGQRIYQLGNNLHHEWIYKEAMQHPGVIVL